MSDVQSRPRVVLTGAAGAIGSAVVALRIGYRPIDDAWVARSA